MRKLIGVLILLVLVGGLTAAQPDFNIVGGKKIAIPAPPAGKGWHWDNDNSKWWQLLPTPSLPPAPPIVIPTKPKAVFGPVVGYHTHTCPRCGTQWGHANNDPNASHRCPKCGTMQYIQDR